jgi:HK97 family phage major capsid protein
MAEVVTCTRKEALLQSLIENIARTKPGSMDFARELKRLHDEGLEYKQSAFDLAIYTYTVRKITAYIILSEELLEDVEGLSSYISVRLPEKLRVKENQQLLYGSGGGVQLSGLTTNATAYTDNLADDDISRIDILVDAFRQVRDDEYEPTFALIHPTDATLIKLTKDDNGNYIHPWIFMGNGQIVLDGVPVYVSTAITSGQFLVGDGKLGAQVFDRRQATLEMSFENEDNFIKGMVTVRIAERLTLATYRAKAFIYGSCAAALAQGSA